MDGRLDVERRRGAVHRDRSTAGGAGLVKNGARFTHRRTACQWMRAMTPKENRGMRTNADKQRHAGHRPQPTGQARDEQRSRAAVITGFVTEFVAAFVIFDARHRSVGPVDEAEAVSAGDRAERRDVEDLRRREFLAGADRPLVAMREQIAVALAERVVDLADDRTQRSVPAMAEPEADRLERVAQHAREGMQPDLAVRVDDALGRQQVGDPGDERHRPTRVAVVAVVERQQVEPVVRQDALIAQRRVEPAHRQPQEIDRIAERVGSRPPARVAHLPERDLRGRGHVDGSGQAARRASSRSAVCHPTPRSSVATSRPLFSPSS